MRIRRICSRSQMTRKFAGLAGLLAGATLALSANGARAECAQWDLRGDWRISQRNNIVVHVSVDGQDGRNVWGRARWLKRADNSGVLNDLGIVGDDPDLWISGNLEGTTEGSNVRFKVYWDNNTVGIYDGAISAMGRLEGSNWDQARPDIRVGWFSTSTMDCRMQAGPLVIVPPSAIRPEPEPPRADRPVTGLGQRFPRSQPAPAPDRSGAVTTEPGGFANALDRCKPGFVWREARPSDLVCVTPESRDRVAEENRTAFDRGDPRRNYCVPGFVWREAFDGDVVCVYPEIRAMVREENRLGPGRRVGG